MSPNAHAQALVCPAKRALWPALLLGAALLLSLIHI